VRGTDPVGKGHGLVGELDQRRVVRGAHDGEPPLVGRSGEERADGAGVLLVEPRGRLVDEEQRGVGRERPGDRDALTLACRELGDAAVHPLGQSHLRERGLGPAGVRAVAVSQPHPEPHVLERAQIGDQPRLLGDECHLAAP